MDMIFFVILMSIIPISAIILIVFIMYHMLVDMDSNKEKRTWH